MLARLLRRGSLVPVLLAALMVLAVGSAQAKPGGLDPSFGSTGVVRTAFDSEPTSEAAVNGIVVQPDGKIVAAGGRTMGQSIYDFESFSLARYTARGSLDTSFGSGGRISMVFCCAGGARGIALQPDGKIVVVEPDGKIVTAGYSYDGNRTSYALARYNPDGSLDATFGSGGTVTTPMGPQFDFAQALALQPDGKIVVGGYTHLPGDRTDIALARFNSDGSLDTSFGTGGKVMTGVPGYQFIFDIALQTDGKIVAAGTDGPPNFGFFALNRYNPDGSPDTTFGTNGKVTTEIGSGRAFATGVAIQPDGKIVAAGSTEAPHPWTIGMARYKEDGSLDAGFGSGGKVTGPVGDGRAVALQSDGKIIVGGSYGAKFQLVRYLSGKERCRVPKVRGKRLEKAKQAIHRAYCMVGRISRDFSNTVRKGRVISQKPKPGARRPARAKVKLVVSKGVQKRRW